MARVHYATVQDRFTHIDASFVRCAVAFPEATATYSVRLYPWWEHPLYLRAREQSLPWGFRGCDEGAKEVTMHARGVVASTLTSTGVGASVTDCYFTTSGPYLWDFEPDGQVFVNEPIDTAELSADVAARLDIGVHALARLLTPPAPGPSYSLRLPLSVFDATVAALTERSVAHHLAYRPPPGLPLVAFVIDGHDHIIAADFDLDVPEFEHRPEWFAP